MLTSGSLHNILEEIILKRNCMDVQRMIGLEGVFGLIYSFLFILAASWFECHNSGICTRGGYLDDIVNAVQEIFMNSGLLFWCMSAIFATLFLNYFGLINIKNTSAVYKAFWESMSTIIIWVVNVLAGNKDLILLPAMIQILGFMFLILGNLTYNEIIEWSFWGLNKNLSKYR
jgi:hypothetical protein